MALPFLQTSLADSEQQSSAALSEIMHASAGLSQLVSIAESLLGVAVSEGLRQARTRRAEAMLNQSIVDELEAEPRLLSLNGDEDLRCVALLAWQAAALLWGGIVNLSSRSRFCVEAQSRWAASLYQLLSLVGGALTQLEAEGVHPRAVALAFGLDSARMQGFGLKVLAELASSSLTAGDLVGDIERNLGVVCGASALLARAMRATSASASSPLQLQAIGADAAMDLLPDHRRGAVAALSRAWSATHMHWRHVLGCAVINCNVVHALALSCANCRRVTRSIVRASTGVRTLVDGLPRWMAARGAIADEFASMAITAAFRDTVLCDQLAVGTERGLSDYMHGSDLFAHSLSIGMNDTTRVDPGQTAPTAIFENLVGDRAIFRAEASAMVWRTVAVHRAASALGRFASSFASARSAAAILHRSCSRCEDVVTASGAIPSEAGRLARSRQPWEQACVQVNMRVLLCLGEIGITQSIGEAGVPSTLLHAPASLLVPVRPMAVAVARRLPSSSSGSPSIEPTADAERHRQDQAWTRWLRASLHGMRSDEDQPIAAIDAYDGESRASERHDAGDVQAMRRSLQSAGLRAAIAPAQVIESASGE